MEDDIDGIDPERVIPEAIAMEDEEAMGRLLTSVWLYKLLNLVSGRVSRRFKVDADELLNYLYERVEKKLHTVTNPQGIPWADRLTRWAFRVAKNRAKNLIRRRRGAEQRHHDEVAHENTVKLTDRKRTAALRSTALSQDDEIARKDQAARRPTIRQATRKAYDSLTPRDAWLVSLWMGGMTFQKISDVTGVPLSTVGDRVKVFQKTVLKEVVKAAGEGERAAQLLKAVNKHADGVRQLLASSLVETSPRGGGLRASV